MVYGEQVGDVEEVVYLEAIVDKEGVDSRYVGNRPQKVRDYGTCGQREK